MQYPAPSLISQETAIRLAAEADIWLSHLPPFPHSHYIVLMQITASEIKLSGEYPHLVPLPLPPRPYIYRHTHTHTHIRIHRQLNTPLCGTAGDQLRVLHSEAGASTAGRVTDAPRGSSRGTTTPYLKKYCRVHNLMDFLGGLLLCSSIRDYCHLVSM